MSDLCMMIRLLFCCFLTAGISLGVQVHQTPSALIRNAGDDVQIVCTHEQTDYRVMLWYQQSQGKDKGLKLIGYVDYSTIRYEELYKNHFNVTGDMSGNTAKNGSLFIVDLKVSEHSAVYYCAARHYGNYPAYFGEGTKLTVLEKNHTVTPPTVKVFKPHLKECSGSKDDQKNKTLVCVASGFYPDHVNVTWEVNGNDVRGNSSFGMTEDPNAVRDGNDYRITSRLRVPAAFWYANHTFTCIVTFFNGTGYEKHTESIFGEAKNGWKTEQLSRIFQTAKLSYGVFIIKSSIYGVFVAFLVWKLQGSAGKQN